MTAFTPEEIQAYLSDEDRLERDGYGAVVKAQAAEFREAGYSEQEALEKAQGALVRLDPLETIDANPVEIIEWVQDNLASPCLNPECAPSKWAYAMLIHMRKNKEGMNKLVDHFCRDALRNANPISERMKDCAENTIILSRRLLKALAPEE